MRITSICTWDLGFCGDSFAKLRRSHSMTIHELKLPSSHCLRVLVLPFSLSQGGDSECCWCRMSMLIAAVLLQEEALARHEHGSPTKPQTRHRCPPYCRSCHRDRLLTGKTTEQRPTGGLQADDPTSRLCCSPHMTSTTRQQCDRKGWHSRHSRALAGTATRIEGIHVNRHRHQHIVA